MYFCVKQRDFEGFLIPVRKPPRQVNVGKIDKKKSYGLKGGSRDLFVLSGGPSG